MADIEITPEAIAAQRAYDQADAHVRALTDQLPPGTVLASGAAVISDEQREALDKARTARLDALHKLREERAKLGPGNSIAIETALREAARTPAE
ncbi:hypothetical protein ABZW11_26730 [Nonomuraea sp. NPDC004580]|uniref:hypothetical protein n=1 Tax=Nonomuraea sp. NPDC004580 TaxID=3154552 RepID=UPI0033B34287